MFSEAFFCAHPLNIIKFKLLIDNKYKLIYIVPCNYSYFQRGISIAE